MPSGSRSIDGIGFNGNPKGGLRELSEVASEILSSAYLLILELS